MRERRASRPLVLIADDSIDVREMYEEYLNAVGYRVVTASNGREAVIFARVSRPDVVVMDLQMPNVDGWAAIRELQHDAKTASLPVIALTGHDLKYSAMAEGAVSYLTKPIIPEHLAREIAVCLEQSRMKQRRAV
jgi:CheY-like chemotaxis protein